MMLKNLVAITLIGSLMLGNANATAVSSDNVQDTESMNFADTYAEEIEEALALKRDESFLKQLESKGIFYHFQDDVRIDKVIANTVVQYTYNEYGKVIQEVSNGDTVEYTYQNGRGMLSCATYNGIKYSAVCDVDGNVIALENEDGITIAEYIYTNGIADIVVVNQLCQEDASVGGKNKVRWHSLYFDDETGYYYTGGRFMDSAKGSFVDTIPSDAYTPCFSMMQRDHISQMASDVTNWVDYLLYLSPNYGAPLDASTDWANDLSDVEVLARLIYAENPYKNKIDQRAITWTVLNRLYDDGFSDTLREIALAPNQFATSGQGSWDARNPAAGYEAWKDATWLACAICTTTKEEDCRGLFGKPNGITNQLFFYSLESFANVCKDSSNGIVYNGNVLKDVTVVGDEFNAISHLVNATTLDQIRNCTKDCKGKDIRPSLPSNEKFHNVFYNRK